MMMKKSIIIPTVFLGMLGGYALAQSDIFTFAEKTSTITAAQAKSAALKAFNGNIVEFEYDHDDVIPHYNFEIASQAEKVDLEVDAATGAVTITKRETIKNTAQTAVQQATGQAQKPVANPQTTEQQAVAAKPQTTEQQVTKQQAIEQQAVVAKPQTNEQQSTKQQVAATKPQTTEQQAASQQTNGLITKAQAIAIAQQKASGTVTKVKFDREDNEYEIEIVNGQTEYEFDIDATTGTIISYEEDIYD